MAMMRSLIFIITALFLVSCGSSDQDLYCKGLIGTAKQGDVASRLEAWSVANVFRVDIKRADIKFEGRVVPGFYRFHSKSFDWDVIGFDSLKSQVRLVGPHVEHVTDNGVKNIKSVFFAERSRCGYIVKSKESENYGIGSDSKYLTSISYNVAVLCIIAK